MDQTSVSDDSKRYTNPPNEFKPTIIRPVVNASTGSQSIVVIRPNMSAKNPVIGSTTKLTPINPHPIKISAPGTVIRPIIAKSATNPVVANQLSFIKTVPATERPASSEVKVEQPSASTSASTSATNRNIIREMHVRVPNRSDKRFNVLRFHSSDRPDLSAGVELFMQRENNLKQFRNVYNLNDGPETGAGSEYGRETKEVSRLKKHGVIRDQYRPDDQPWIMTVGKGKSGRRRFRGVREGSVSDNVEYFVFCQCKDGNFDAYPVHSWYKMKPEITYRFLREDEAEIEYNKMHRTMNLFNVMIKRKLTDGDADKDDDLEISSKDRELGKELRYLSVATESKKSSATKDGGSRESKSAYRRMNRSLKLTDFEELESGSDLDDDDDEDPDKEENGGGPQEVEDASKSGIAGSKLRDKEGKLIAGKSRLLKKKQRQTAIVTRMRRQCKKRRARKKTTLGSSSEDDDPLDEARDDSEIDDHEGDEVDYMTNSSSDEEKLSIEDRDRIYEETGVDEEAGLRALLTDLSSDEEEGQNLNFESDADESLDESKSDPNQSGAAVAEADQGGKSARKKRGNGEALSSSSSSSSVEGDSSTYSSSSDSDIDLDEQLKKSSKKQALLQKLSDSIHSSLPNPVEQPNVSNDSLVGSKRRSAETADTPSPSSAAPVNKKPRPEVSSPVVSTPSSSSSSADSELMSAVRKYLTRKPITVTELLRKIRLRKLVGKNEDAQTALANVLRQLRPIKQIINGQHALSLKP